MHVIFLLAVGILLVWGIHHLLQKAAQTPPSQLRKKGGIVAMAALLLGSLYSPLLRQLLFLQWFRQAGQKSTHTAPEAEMSVSQAREILGVSEQATKQDIETAYRNLMRQHHPDQGGHAYFAKQLNQARDILRRHI